MAHADRRPAGGRGTFFDFIGKDGALDIMGAYVQLRRKPKEGRRGSRGAAGTATPAST